LFRVFRYFITGEFKVKIFDFYVYSSSNKKKTSYALIKKCGFDDEHELKIIKKFNKSKNIFFFDCGSNFGFYSLFVSSLSRNNRIVAFEASIETKLQFDRNVQLNNFKNIISYNKAISNTPNQELSLNLSSNDWENSLCHSDFQNFKNQSVITTTIDYEMKYYNFSKNFILIIKLDVEGYEFNVIKGSENTINKFSPLIIIELSKYNLENKEYNLSYFEEFLNYSNYKIYDLQLKIVEIKDIVNRLNLLDKSHKTIGNYYLVKKNSLVEKILLLDTLNEAL
jgi:FkbM family methyltransferase